VATVFADLTSIEGARKSLGSLLPTSTIYMASERVKARPDIAQHLANAFVRALKYINSHTSEEVLAIIPAEISGKDRAAYLAALKEEMPMFASDGRMPAEDAVKEWQVLSEFNPKFKSVKVGETYTNAFVDEALRRYR
jgi:NitT/TauT family transport system substrate-binding protein